MKVVNRYSDLTEQGFGSRATIWRKIQAKEFPPPENILGRPGWRDTRIKQFLDSCEVMDADLGHEDV